VKSHSFNADILKEYDIRGIFGKTLFPEDAYAIGRCFAKAVLENGGKIIGVARDGRMSSPICSRELLKGILDEGLDAIDLGLGPTPLLYYSMQVLKTDAGIMVTGSHNPPDHNGFKMLLKDRVFLGDDIRDFQNRAKHFQVPSHLGTLYQKDILASYVNYLVNQNHIKDGLRIVWDAGNGATGKVIEKLTQHLPGTHTLLHTTIDPLFPNHHPDPSVEENMQDLKAKVLELKADIGFAFDGDGDRVGAVDNKGNIWYGEDLMMLFVEDVLTQHPGATIIADVKISDVVFDKIKALGGKPLMHKTGHSGIKATLKNIHAPFAGEYSGHMFFIENNYYDDGLYGAIRLLNILSKSHSPLSGFYNKIPHLYKTAELTFPCETTTQKQHAIHALKTLMNQEGIKFCDIDGVRVTEADGWWLLRASNTQNILTGRCEAQTPKALERLSQKLYEYVRKILQV
jgi:phosphomannomutase